MMGGRKLLDEHLKNIQDDILRLGSLVGQAADLAVQAFIKNDLKIAGQVVEGDNEIDALHHRLEEDIIATVALQQPMAADLRHLIAALLITNELERMGDYAEGTARTVLRSEGSPSDIPPQFMEMSALVIKMIENVMDAFVTGDVEKARATARMDDQLDALYKQQFSQIVQRMGKGEEMIEQGTYLLWATHNMERIGDRVTNICERITYAVTGDIGSLNL
jgi:phosphate transport system protein